MNTPGFRHHQVSPPLAAADKAAPADFSHLAFALLREMARYDADLADRAQSLGLDIGSWSRASSHRRA